MQALKGTDSDTRKVSLLYIEIWTAEVIVLNKTSILKNDINVSNLTFSIKTMSQKPTFEWNYSNTLLWKEHLPFIVYSFFFFFQNSVCYFKYQDINKKQCFKDTPFETFYSKTLSRHVWKMRVLGDLGRGKPLQVISFSASSNWQWPGVASLWN